MSEERAPWRVEKLGLLASITHRTNATEYRVHEGSEAFLSLSIGGPYISDGPKKDRLVRLIGAAPELLAVCEELVEEWSNGISPIDVVKKAEKLVARIEG